MLEGSLCAWQSVHYPVTRSLTVRNQNSNHTFTAQHKINIHHLDLTLNSIENKSNISLLSQIYRTYCSLQSEIELQKVRKQITNSKTGNYTKTLSTQFYKFLVFQNASYNIVLPFFNFYHNHFAKWEKLFHLGIKQKNSKF